MNPKLGFHKSGDETQSRATKPKSGVETQALHKNT